MAAIAFPAMKRRSTSPAATWIVRDIERPLLCEAPSIIVEAAADGAVELSVAAVLSAEDGAPLCWYTAVSCTVPGRVRVIRPPATVAAQVFDNAAIGVMSVHPVPSVCCAERRAVRTPEVATHAPPTRAYSP